MKSEMDSLFAGMTGDIHSQHEYAGYIAQSGPCQPGLAMVDRSCIQGRVSNATTSRRPSKDTGLRYGIPVVR